MKMCMKLGPLLRNTRQALAADKTKARYLVPAARALLVLAVGTVAAVPGVALASGPWDSMGNQVLAIFTGGLTRTIAIISVIACGIAALAGKLSWDWAIKIIVGVVLIFGGTSLVDYLIAAAS